MSINHQIDTTTGKPATQKSSGGAAHARIVASDVPELRQTPLAWTGIAGAADNAVLYTSVDLAGYGSHVVENASAVAIDVQVSVDGTNYNTTPPSVRLHDDVTTGGGVNVVSIAAGKIGTLTGFYKSIKVLQAAAGTINAGEVRGAHGIV